MCDCLEARDLRPAVRLILRIVSTEMKHDLRFRANCRVSSPQAENSDVFPRC